MTTLSTVQYWCWVIQAIFALPMAFLLKYVAVGLEEEATKNDKNGEQSRLLRFTSLHEVSTSVFFLWILFWSIINAMLLLPGVATSSNAADLVTVKTILLVMGALVTAFNAPNLWIITFLAIKKFLKTKERKHLISSLISFHLCGIITLLTIIWSILAFHTAGTGNHVILATGFDARIALCVFLEIIAFLCFSLFFILIWDILTNFPKEQRLPNETKFHYYSKLATPMVLQVILLCFGGITLTVGLTFVGIN